MRTIIALAAGMSVALAAAPALGQGPSYENRGYGGPLYVGPNFEKGGQHAPPVYGAKPQKPRATAKRSPDGGKSREAAKAAKPEKAEKESASSSSGTVPSAGIDTEAATADTTEPSAKPETAAAPATCKRFDATSGQTITVPCE